MTEEWRPVVGYEGRYEVSNQGRVRSMIRTPRILLASVGNRGYRVARLSLGSRASQRGKLVHRLVLEAFRGGPPTPLHIACHNNGDPLDNRIENLRWATQGENQRDSILHGTHRYASRTHCKHGHEYTPDNIQWLMSQRVPGRRYRQCRICRRGWEAAAKQRKRSQAA